MISIVIAMRSLWACKILNEDKTIEVRKGLALYNVLKKAEERGEEVEFLMYVTKAKPFLAEIYDYDHDYSCNETTFAIAGKGISESEIQSEYGELNGKVVAKFKAKAKKIKHHRPFDYDDWRGYYLDRGFCEPAIREIELMELTCLNYNQLDDYLKGKESTALCIEDLEPLPEPKTLADYGLKRAPQSWCYAKKGGLNGKS